MSRETYALFTGLFVIVLGAALIAITSYLGNYGAARDVYTLVSKDSVAGLNPESVVMFRGVQAGKVTSIRFDSEDPENILVQIEIERGLPVTKGTYATLRVQALTGLAQVELVDSGEYREPLPSTPEAPARMLLQPSPFEKLTQSAQELLPRLTELTTRLSDIADEGNRVRLQNILSNLELASRELIAVEAKLTDVLVGLPKLNAHARTTLDEMTRLSRDLTQSSRDIRALAHSTEGLVSAGKIGLESLTNKTIPKADALIVELQRAAASAKRLSRQIEADPQSLLLGRPRLPPGPGEPGHQGQP